MGRIHHRHQHSPPQTPVRDLVVPEQITHQTFLINSRDPAEWAEDPSQPLKLIVLALTYVTCRT